MRVERWGWYSVGVNVILAGINLAIAVASGSLAVRAEMVHNVVDFATAVAVVIGLRLATRKSGAFPYGLYKVENVVAVGLAFAVFLTAYEVARDALLSAPTRPTVDPWMLVGLAAALAIPLVFSRYELRAGREANSPALIADAKEYRVHAFTTGIVLAALVGQRFDLPLDRAAALLVVVAVVKTGWDLLVDGMRVLLDASLDAETLRTIGEVIAADPRVARLRWVTGRNAGRYRFVEAGIVLRVEDLARAEATTRRLEGRIREAVPHVERVLLHIEREERTELRYAAPLADHVGTISPHLGDAPVFGFVTVRLPGGAVQERRSVANPYREEERARGLRVAEWLVERKVDVLLVMESLQGRGPEYAFADAGVELATTAGPTLEDAVAEHLRTRRPDDGESAESRRAAPPSNRRVAP